MSGKYRYSLWEMTVRLLKIASPVKGALFISTMASIIGNLSQMGLMAFGAGMLLSTAGFDAGGFGRNAAGMGACALLIVICRYTEGVVSHAGAYSLLAYMRIRLFDTIRRIAPARLMDREKGDIMNIAVSDIETVEFFFAHTIGPMFTVIILPCTALVMAFMVSPLYAAVLLPIYILISVVFPLIAVRMGRGVGREYRERLGKLKSQVLESIYGLKDIQIFGYGQKRLETVLNTNRSINKAAHLMTLHRQMVTSAPTFLVYLARIAIVASASYLAARGASDPAGTIIVSFAATASFSSTQSLTMVVSSLLETYAAAERIFILEDTEPAVKEAADPEECGNIEHIEFRNVSFRYEGGERDILSGFSLDIGRGEKIGIVGQSGIGKSTVLRLLMRFWEPDGGQILINGKQADKLSLKELRRRIAFLEQDTFIFSGTVAENIALGKPDATMEEIQKAAQRAGIHDFISSLPDGYDTPMGSMGGRLSGGERQRVGIARMMLMDPDVIIMDEPTSSLDILNEKGLLVTLKKEFGGKMMIIVSHRPSTLSDCTRIIDLKKGMAFERQVAAC